MSVSTTGASGEGGIDERENTSIVIFQWVTEG